MAGFSDFWEQKILEHLFGITPYTAQASLWLALFTTGPNDAGTGGVEVTGGSYARVEIVNDGTNWDFGAGIITNLTAITFPTATADWGVIVRACLMSASSSGNLLATSDAISFEITSGLEAYIDIGDLSFSLD